MPPIQEIPPKIRLTQKVPTHRRAASQAHSADKKRPVKKGRIPVRAWLLTLALSIVLSGLVIIVATQILLQPKRAPQVAVNPVQQVLNLFALPEKTLLVMGVDVDHSQKKVGGNHQSFEGVRSDTMMLVKITPAQHKVAIVSIPRDSRVYIARGMGVDKINGAFARGGASLAVQTVQEALGVNIDNFVVVNTQGIKEVVDALGGVRIYVEKPMHYHDFTGRLFVDFEPGYVTMNGRQAEAFLRFRHDATADIGRVGRQQHFIAAVKDKLKSPWVVTQLPSLIQLGLQYVQTDLSPQDLMSMLSLFKEIDLKHLTTATLPGQASGGPVSYWLLDTAGTQQVLSRLILNRSIEGSPAVRSAGQVKIGLLHSAQVPQKTIDLLRQHLEAQGLSLSCQHVKRRLPTQVVLHNSQLPEKVTELPGSLLASFRRAPVHFSPVAASIDNVHCSPNDDITLVLGDDSLDAP